MALTPNEQEFVDWVKSQLPRYYFISDRAVEIVGAFAKMFGAAKDNDVALFEQTYITTSTGGPPDFLQQHALDRGTQRQDSETDDALIERLRNYPDAVSKQALIDAANLILEAEGLPQTAALVELRHERIFLNTNLPGTGTGGTFGTVASDFYFEPTAPPQHTVQAGATIVFSGAASAANNGTYEILALSGNKIIIQNPSGVNGADGSVSWTTNRINGLGIQTTQFKDSYLNRGFRLTKSGPSPIIIVILPYGSTVGTEASILEMLRQKKAAGIGVVVERRASP